MRSRFSIDDTPVTAAYYPLFPNRSIVCELILGWRRVEVTQQRTAVDYAHLLKTLVDQDYPEAVKITVVQDNLNTHSPASLYKAFEPAEAQRILSHLEFDHTPKHGSRLNMAEIELSVLSRQCLDRRISDFSTLKTEVDAWQEQRNQEKTWIDWRFTTADARVKLHRLYPSTNNRQTTRSFQIALSGLKTPYEAE